MYNGVRVAMKRAAGLSSGIKGSSMAKRKDPGEVDLDSYYRGRIADLGKRILDDTPGALFSKESLQKRREFEDRVEQRLQNGAKYIPRKRQPS
jgi:hypothetical protein